MPTQNVVNEDKKAMQITYLDNYSLDFSLIFDQGYNLKLRFFRICTAAILQFLAPVGHSSILFKPNQNYYYLIFSFL